ncbi:MAG: SIS domain-containing protein [Chloroflexi bacterium]|nr:SIS domain-containing protein [Chloroflexota bacterium]
MIDDTHLYREIHEQPQSLRRLIDEQQGVISELADMIQRRHIRHVVIAARGTSDNAGRYAQYLLGAMNGLPVGLTTPSLFTIYRRPPVFDESALVIGISQSGASPDIVAVLESARAQGALTAVLTNTPASPLAEQGDVVIDLCAGEERAVAATKTYTAELAAIALLSALHRGDETMLAALHELPEAVADTLAMEEEIARVAPRYRYMSRCVVISRGFNYATAFEIALKLKELTYTVVEPYSSADFLHGPLAMVEPGFPIFLVAPAGEMSRELVSFCQTLRAREAELIAISDEERILKLARIPLALPHRVPEWLSPVTAIVPGQLLALHLAHTRDYDVDAPRSLQKVTETI